jgi:hypothetical protein
MNILFKAIIGIFMLPINLIKWCIQLIIWIILLPFRLLELVFNLPFWILTWLLSFMHRTKTVPAEIVRIWQDPVPGASSRYWTYVLFDSRGKKIQVKLDFFEVKRFLAENSEGDVGTLTHRGKWLVKWQAASEKKPVNLSKHSRKGLVFISYSHEWQADAKYIADFLKGRNINVWFDEDRLDAGDSLKEEIVKVIEKAKYCIPLLSKDYFHSRWCRDELDLAVTMGVKIVPVKVEEGNIFSNPAIKRLYRDKLGEPVYIDFHKKHPRKKLAQLAERIR